MTPEQIFGICNTVALASWVALAALPRWPIVAAAIRWGVISGLATLYSVLVMIFFFRVEGGGFSSLASVQTLFADPRIALAGWVHYLAFDLFIGLWIAARADALAISRLVQVPILLATFMFGPFGLLLMHGVVLATRFALPFSVDGPGKAK